MSEWYISLCLVILLYLLLVYDLIAYYRSRIRKELPADAKRKKLMTSYKPVGSVGPIKKPSGGSSLDGLWRRMKQATANLESSGMDHGRITEAMAEARRLEREKLSALLSEMEKTEDS